MIKIIELSDGVRLEYKNKGFLYLGFSFFLLTVVTFVLFVYYEHGLSDSLLYSFPWFVLGIFFILGYKIRKIEMFPGILIYQICSLWNTKKNKYQMSELKKVRVELSTLKFSPPPNSRLASVEFLIVLIIVSIASYLGILGNVKILLKTKQKVLFIGYLNIPEDIFSIKSDTQSVEDLPIELNKILMFFIEKVPIELYDEYNNYRYFVCSTAKDPNI